MDRQALFCRRGFTLIELLIVVAIIAILAAIAVPNFMEAQARAKVSRCKADMRSVATAIESYKVDTNDYPPGYGLMGSLNTLVVLSTPVAYITKGLPLDIFAVNNSQTSKQLMTYEAHNGQNQMLETSSAADSSGTKMWWVNPANDSDTRGPKKAVWWWLACRGPSLAFSGFGKKSAAEICAYGSDVPDNTISAALEDGTVTTQDGFRTHWMGMIYDATNGTRSIGNISRAGGAASSFAGSHMSP
jgi:type II secretion system protein G